MNEELTELYGMIAQLDYEDAYEVQHALSARIKLLTKQKTRMMNVGDKVCFEDKNGKHMTGKITKIMRKNIKVQVDDGVYPHDTWTVHPSFLTVVK